MHRRRAEESRDEVADGSKTDARLPAADPSHVHVGLRRAAVGARRPSRPLDARPLHHRPASAASGANDDAEPRRPVASTCSTNASLSRRRRLARASQITAQLRLSFAVITSYTD